MTDAKTHARDAAKAQQGAPEVTTHEKGGQGNPYVSLGLMAFFSFTAMFVLMYAMVNLIENALPNINQAYMAALMAAPMAVIELALMRHMYKSTKWNAVTIGASVLVFVLAFFAIRQQTLIGDDQFLRSMIPHHAAAIQMCQNAPITDAEIQRLCRGIVANQSSEIAQMKAIMARRS